MKKLYYIFLTFLVATSMYGQQPLTDKIVIEFMKPGDLDAQARNYNLVPWPEEAKAAAYKAAEIWASYLEITVPIRVKFGWCDNIEANAEGGTKFNYQYTDGYYYPLPLINQLLGYDKNKDVVDIICVFKSELEVGWYFGLDGKVGLTPDPNDSQHHFFQEDFVTIAMHELCHGLGIGGDSFNITGGKGNWGGSVSGKANIYDTFICDKNSNQLINETHYKNNSDILATVLTSDEVYWNGSNAVAASEDNVVKIHAPKEWSSSSICHLDAKYARTNNNIMAYGLGGVTNSNGVGITYFHGTPPIILGMLQDIGWTLKDNPTANENIEFSSSIKVYTTKNQLVIEGAETNDQVMVFNISGCLVYSGKGDFNINLPSGLYIARVADQSFKIKL